MEPPKQISFKLLILLRPKQEKKKKPASTHSFIAPVFENVEFPRNHGLKTERQKIKYENESGLWRQGDTAGECSPRRPFPRQPPNPILGSKFGVGRPGQAGAVGEELPQLTVGQPRVGPQGLQEGKGRWRSGPSWETEPRWPGRGSLPAPGTMPWMAWPRREGAERAEGSVGQGSPGARRSCHRNWMW